METNVEQLALATSFRSLINKLAPTPKQTACFLLITPF